jgi:hypothetical protein
MGQAFAASCGDVNDSGDTDIIDALLIAQYYVELNPLNFDLAVADVNGDESIDPLLFTSPRLCAEQTRDPKTRKRITHTMVGHLFFFFHSYLHLYYCCFKNDIILLIK